MDGSGRATCFQVRGAVSRVSEAAVGPLATPVRLQLLPILQALLVSQLRKLHRIVLEGLPAVMARHIPGNEPAHTKSLPPSARRRPMLQTTSNCQPPLLFVANACFVEGTVGADACPNNSISVLFACPGKVLAFRCSCIPLCHVVLYAHADDCIGGEGTCRDAQTIAQRSKQATQADGGRGER